MGFLSMSCEEVLSFHFNFSREKWLVLSIEHGLKIT